MPTELREEYQPRSKESSLIFKPGLSQKISIIIEKTVLFFFGMLPEDRANWDLRANGVAEFLAREFVTLRDKSGEEELRREIAEIAADIQRRFDEEVKGYPYGQNLSRRFIVKN